MKFYNGSHVHNSNEVNLTCVHIETLKKNIVGFAIAFYTSWHFWWSSRAAPCTMNYSNFSNLNENLSEHLHNILFQVRLQMVYQPKLNKCSSGYCFYLLFQQQVWVQEESPVNKGPALFEEHCHIKSQSGTVQESVGFYLTAILCYSVCFSVSRS